MLPTQSDANEMLREDQRRRRQETTMTHHWRTPHAPDVQAATAAYQDTRDRIAGEYGIPTPPKPSPADLYAKLSRAREQRDEAAMRRERDDRFKLRLGQVGFGAAVAIVAMAAFGVRFW